jgi:hypothetical protein
VGRRGQCPRQVREIVGGRGHAGERTARRVERHGGNRESVSAGREWHQYLRRRNDAVSKRDARGAVSAGAQRLPPARGRGRRPGRRAGDPRNRDPHQGRPASIP